MYRFFVIAIYLIAYLRYIISEESSPCPSLFSYENQKKDSWVGVITYTSTDPINGIWIRIELSNKTDILSSAFGAVTTSDNTKFLISDPSFELNRNRAFQFKILAKFTYQKSAPKLISIEFNGKQVCPEVLALTGDKKEVLDKRFRKVIGRRDGFGRQNNYLLEEEPTPDHCGTVLVPQGLILNGQPTIEGQFPWHAAIYTNASDSVEPRYFCGGSLITTKHILTAAHCTIGKKTSDLSVLLGRYDLSTFNEHVQTRGVSKIFVHPGFNNFYFYNDTAILELSAPVRITEYVRTICLWRGDPDKQLFGQTGVIVGWGFNIHKQINRILHKAHIPVISSDVCKASDISFYSFLMYTKNFCAGYRNGTAPCRGDSGGGLIFQYTNDDNQTYWYIRGLVSASKPGKYECDDSTYALFTHVDKFIDWIEETIGTITDNDVIL